MGDCPVIDGQYKNYAVARLSSKSSSLRNIGTSETDLFSGVLTAFATSRGGPHGMIKSLTIRRDGVDRLVITGSHAEAGQSISLALVRSGTYAAIPPGEDPPAYTYTYDCRDGFVQISNWAWLPISPIGAGAMRLNSMQMRKAVDGSLVVRVTETKYMTAPLYPIPIAPGMGRDDYDDWFRFALYDSEKDNSERDARKTSSGRDDSQGFSIPEEDYLSCFSGGKRMWTYRSKCD